MTMLICTESHFNRESSSGICLVLFCMDWFQLDGHTVMLGLTVFAVLYFN